MEEAILTGETEQNQPAQTTPGEADTPRFESVMAEFDVQGDGGGTDPPHNDVAAWERINGCRLNLIEKQHTHNLSSDELALLDGLNAAMVRRVNAITPLPWGALERLKAEAKELGITLDQTRHGV